MKTSQTTLHIRPQNDLDLIRRYKVEGDRTSLERLFTQYHKSVFGLAHYYLRDRSHAEDVTMNTFEIVLRRLGQVEITNFKSWILSICRNQALKHLRDHKKHEEMAEIQDDRVEKDDLRVYKDKCIEKLIRFIAGLKEHQRRCIEAFYLYGYSYQEVAGLYGYSDKEVKSHIQNGKRQLKLKLERTMMAMA